MSATSIPYCPVMSAGCDIPVVCTQDRCAWYLKGAKACSIYVLAHKSALDIKQQTQYNR